MKCVERETMIESLCEIVFLEKLRIWLFEMDYSTKPGILPFFP